MYCVCVALWPFTGHPELNTRAVARGVTQATPEIWLATLGATPAGSEGDT